MKSEFSKFQDFLKRVRNTYFNTLCAFYTYEALEELKATNIDQKKAEENVAIMNHFKNFFATTLNATINAYLLGLAKILDNHRDDPISIPFLIKYAEKHKAKFTVEEFEKFNQGRKLLDDLLRRYKIITDQDLDQIKKQLRKIETQRKQIKDIRDKCLAHDDQIKPKIFIKNDEIIKVFKSIAEILDAFSEKTDFSITSYDHVEKECKRDAKNILEYLKRFESYRIKEISSKYKL